MHNFEQSVPDRNSVHRLSQVQWSGDVGTRLGAVFSIMLTLWYCFVSHGLGVRFEISSGFSGAGHGQGSNGRNYSFMVIRFVWISLFSILL